jgi:nucleotide-binding universal stress UspA family protein
MAGDPDLDPRLSARAARADPLARTREQGGSGRDTAAVIIGLDGSETSWRAFFWGCGEAERLAARAVVVFVSHPAETSTAGAAGLLAAAGCDYPAIHRRDAEQAAELRADTLRHASGRGLEILFVHLRGDPATELRHRPRTSKPT